MIKMHSSAGATTISWCGSTFDADESGVFELPNEAVSDLMAHGLQPWIEPEGTQTAKTTRVDPGKPVFQWSNADLRGKALEMGLSVEGLDRPLLIQAVTEAIKQQASQ